MVWTFLKTRSAAATPRVLFVLPANPVCSEYRCLHPAAMALEAVLKACGDDLSTDNILNQAYPIKDLEWPMPLPAVKINIPPTDPVPVDQMRFMRFNGKSWERFGELQTGNQRGVQFRWKNSPLGQPSLPTSASTSDQHLVPSFSFHLA